MDIQKVKNLVDDLNTYDYLAKKGDYIAITEWSNGEGWDIDINNDLIHLTRGSLDAIIYLTKRLEYEKIDK